MKKREDNLLILCGGKEALEGIKAAKNMGLHVIIMDGNSQCPGRAIGDEFIQANIYDPKEVISGLKKCSDSKKINGVITLAADNTLSVARASEYLGLKSLSIDTALIATNKIKMKEVLKQKGVTVPWFQQIHTLDELNETVCQRPGNYVLKPADSRGARGVVRLDKINECESAYSLSIKHSTSRSLLLEEWLEGPQLSVEAVVWEGKAYVCGIADRNYSRLCETHPFVVEDGGETPSRFSSEFEMSLNQLMTDAANAIGLTEGSIKGDIVITSQGLSIIEVAARLSGGYFCTHTIPMVYRYDLISQVINIAFGKQPSLPQSPLKVFKYQSNRFIFLNEGVVQKISGLPVNNDNIAIFELNIKEGSVIKKISDHTLRAGMIMVVSDSPQKSLNIVNKVLSELNITVKK